MAYSDEAKAAYSPTLPDSGQAKAYFGQAEAAYSSSLADSGQVEAAYSPTMADFVRGSF